MSDKPLDMKFSERWLREVAKEDEPYGAGAMTPKPEEAAGEVKFNPEKPRMFKEDLLPTIYEERAFYVAFDDYDAALRELQRVREESERFLTQAHNAEGNAVYQQRRAEKAEAELRRRDGGGEVTQYGHSWESMQDTFREIVECAQRHRRDAYRDGSGNSQGHNEQLDEDLEALAAICDEEPFVMPLHIRG